jgi:hypothetical protein
VGWLSRLSKKKREKKMLTFNRKPNGWVFGFVLAICVYYCRKEIMALLKYVWGAKKVPTATAPAPSTPAPTTSHNRVIVPCLVIMGICLTAWAISYAIPQLTHPVVAAHATAHTTAHKASCDTSALAYEGVGGVPTKCWTANATKIDRQLRGTLVVVDPLLATFSPDQGRSTLTLLLKVGQYTSSQLPATNLWSMAALGSGAGSQPESTQEDARVGEQSGPPYNTNFQGDKRDLINLFYGEGQVDSYTNAGSVVRPWTNITEVMSADNHVVVSGSVRGEITGMFKLDVPFKTTCQPAAYFGWLGSYDGDRLTILPVK